MKEYKLIQYSNSFPDDKILKALSEGWEIISAIGTYTCVVYILIRNDKQ